MNTRNEDSLIMKPLTPELWADFENLFGPRGAGGCWCMWWRVTREEFRKNQGKGNRLAIKKIVDSGQVPGLVAYKEGNPCGWCSIAPREEFASLERSRILKRIDGEAVWSLVCFFVHKKYRGENLLEKIITGAIDYVKSKGGKIIEAYPAPDRKEKRAPASAYMGIAKVFTRTGFKEMNRPSKNKIIMRCYL